MESESQHPPQLTLPIFGPECSSSQSLLSLLSEGYDSGKAHFGDLRLNQNAFAERIQSIVRKHLGFSLADSEILTFASKLHLRDLYLATACATESIRLNQRDTLGWETLNNVYGGFIHDLARFISHGNRMASDLADDMLADLYMPDLSGKSRIFSYDGRSSLSTWLRVVLANRITNARRSKAYSLTDEITDQTAERPGTVSIDSIVRIKRYGSPLVNAIKTACGRLKADEKLLLLWRYVHGLQLQQIGKLLGVHQSNVTRRMDRVCQKLRGEVFALLGETHSLSKEAITECVHDLVEHSQEAISISDLVEGAHNGGKAEMKHISEIIREHLRDEAYIRTHEPEILEYYVQRAAMAKKKPGSVPVGGLRNSSDIRKPLDTIER